MKLLRDNGISIVLFSHFALTLVGQFITGLAENNSDREQHHLAPLSAAEYLTDGHFIEVTFENWESEFLQMSVYVIFTIFLYQRGSSESKTPGTTEHVDVDPYFSGDAKRGGAISFIADRIPEIGPLVLLKGLLGNAVPRAVEATEFVRDGEYLLGEFTVIGTPGHTDGHTSYFHHPSKTLFAGDALAVVGKSLRLMSRFVTPHKDRALESAIKCLDHEMDLVCPGHRYPLQDGVEVEHKRFLKLLRSQTTWPFFG